jgi:hypothetical protein
MKYFYSPSTKGFYINTIHRNKIPNDAIEITKQEWRDLRAGKNIAIGPSGRPETKPSRWHTLNSGGNDWEITPENQALKDALDAERIRRDDIETARTETGFRGLTIEEKRQRIRNLFSDVPAGNPMKSPTIKALNKILALTTE